MRGKKWRGFLLAGMMIGSIVFGSEEAVKVQASGVEEAWANMFGACAVVEGTRVSYGPITLEMPENFVIEDKSSTKPTFYAVDRLNEAFTANITISTAPLTVTVTDSEENKRAVEEALTKNLEEQGAIFQGITSYEETELDGYKVSKADYSLTYEGMTLVGKAYEISEKLNEPGNAVLIEYYGATEDTANQEAVEAAFDTVSLIEGSYENGSMVSMVSPWTRAFNMQSDIYGEEISFDGTTVTYGPLQMELPAGYTQSTYEGEEKIFYAPDGSANFSFGYAEDSFYLYEDRATLQEILQEAYGEEYTVTVTDSTVMEINGYRTVVAKETVSSPETTFQQNFAMIFESVNELMTPVITIYHTGDGSEESVLSTVDAWNSMRITE